MSFREASLNAEMLVAGSVMFATAGQMLLKMGLSAGAGFWSRVPHPLHAPVTAGVACGLLVYGVGTLLWMAAIAKRNVSYLYPLASLNYVLVALGGHYLLHEPLRLGRWIGIGIMVGGMGLLAFAARRAEMA